MTSSMNIPLASPGRPPNRVITQSPAVGFRTMLGGGCPVAITIARNAKSMCDLQAMASARVRSPPPLTHLQGSPRASPVNQRGRVEMVNLSATTGPGISTPQQIPAGRGAVPSEARMVLKAPFQAGPSMQLGVPNRVPPPSVRRTFNTTHTAVVPTVHRSSSADRRCFVQQLPGAGVIGSRQVSGTSEGTEVPLATARTARRMSPIRTACKAGASAAAPVRLQPASLLSKVPLVSSLALNGRREETDEVILQQVTKLQNSLMQQIESTKQQIQRQTAHGAKQVNGHLNPQAVAALSLHGAPVARPVAGTVPALPRSAAAPPARPVAPGAGSLTLPPKPERVERVERVDVLSRSVKLTLPVKEEMEGSQGAQNGRGVRAGAAAARIQRAWKKRKSSRPEVRPEEALPPPVKRLAPQHWAASRIQRAWKISRWRRVFIVDCKRDLGWLGSLDWLQRHNMLYGTELAETEDLEWWYHQQSGAPLDYEVDPWGCRKLREHLNRMWFGGEEPPPEPPARPAPGPAGPAPRAAATNPAVPVARPAPKRASLGGYSGAGRVVPTLRLGQARSLAAPVAVPRPVGTAISPRVEGRQLLSASAATLHRCASPTLIRTHRPGLSAAAPVHVPANVARPSTMVSQVPPPVPAPARMACFAPPLRRGSLQSSPRLGVQSLAAVGLAQG